MQDTNQNLRQAEQALLKRYAELVNSGDAGNWYQEAELEVIAARQALALSAKAVPSTTRHWTECEPVRLASSRTGRVYIAGPMSGLPDFNFPAFNAEAAKLRVQGFAVLNPAHHGIVDGADWADYLRHDIAGLASCERIHLLRGWTKSKGACLEMTIAKALGMTVTYQVDAEMEHSNAPAAVDAQRYRWLREQNDDAFAFAVVKNPHFDVYESPEALDAAIDAAMRKDNT